MTSRNSFFNLLKEDLHRRLWTLILASLVFFGTFVVAFTMVIQNYVGRYSRSSYGYDNAQFIARISNDLCEDFYGCWPWFLVVAIVGAIICGMNGFAYLHSRKQMDFYHSLPVKREMVFAVRLVNGVLIYAIPYLAGLLFTYVVCMLYRVMTWDIFFCGLFFFLFHLMGYLIMYLGTVLAMMLTGKMVIGFFGLCAVNLYAPAVYALGWTLRDTFFVTSYSGSIEFENAVMSTRFLSPVAYYSSLLIETDELENLSGFWKEILIFLLFAAILVAVNLWLYKKRASEKADTAMAFPVTEPVARFLISVPVGVLAGLLFYFIQYEGNGRGSLAWLIFGGLFGAFLCHGIMEALYKGDIKKCLSHKAQMAVTMVLAAVIPLIFLFDVFGYDSYVPKKKDIKSMAVISNEMRFGGSYYDEDGYVSATEYALENMHVTEIDAMYELVELLAEDASKNRAERFFGNRGNYTVTADIYYAGGAEKRNYTDFIIRYTLKDGSEAIRTYEYNYYAVMDLLEQIYNDNNYKSAVHPVFSLLESNVEIREIYVYAPASGTKGDFSNRKEILEALEEDLLNLTFDDFVNTAAIGEITIQFVVGKGINAYEDSTGFLLYPGMTKTLALLRAQGCEIEGIQDSDKIQSITLYYSGTINDLKRNLGMEVDEEEVQKYYEEMSVAYEDYELYYEKYGYYPVTKEVAPETYQDITVVFDNPAEIAEIKKHLVYRQYSSEFGPFPAVESFITPEVYFENPPTNPEAMYWDGVIGWTERYRFLDGEIPQFVIDRLFEELGATEY